MQGNAFRVLFLIENVPYSLDTRVRREAHTLRALGGAIRVICPSDGEKWVRTVEGVRVYHYPKPSFGGGFFAHVADYVVGLVFQSLLTLWVALRHGFDVIHVANPPDLLWVVAAPYRLFGSKRFVFDHHDLVPELFEVRYGQRFKWLCWAVRVLELCSFRLADHVISTNQTFRNIATGRGGKSPEDTSVVRNGPWLAHDYPLVPPDESVRRLGKVVVGYLGIMNEQDHVDNLLEAARIIRVEMGRTDIGFVLIGSGDARPALLAQRGASGLEEAIRMPGTLPWKDVLTTLSAVDLCVQPDPPTAFNRHLTMNKLMEYMALGKACVAYDMPETRFTGGDAVHYVQGTSAHELAAAIVSLADDPARRAQMGQRGRRRIEAALSWEHQARGLVEAYSKLLPDRLSDPASRQV
jgi:glycosyltransferase involved in cell wall biosynthesis